MRIRPLRSPEDRPGGEVVRESYKTMLLLCRDEQNVPSTNRVRRVRDHQGTGAFDQDLELVLRMLRLIVMAPRHKDNDRLRPVLK
jgi:hypothetical protein